MMRVFRRLVFALIGVLILSHSVWLYELSVQAAEVFVTVSTRLTGVIGP